jgi:hypothetical protein
MNPQMVEQYLPRVTYPSYEKIRGKKSCSSHYPEEY